MNPNTITPEMRRELLAAWDRTRYIVNYPSLWMTSPPSTRLWFHLSYEAFGTCLAGPLNVASGC